MSAGASRTGLSGAGLVRRALVAAVLQCVGCQTEAVGTDIGDLRGPADVREATSRDAGVIPAAVDPALLFAGHPARASDAAAQRPSASAYLVTESAFIVHGAISSERADPLLESMALFSKAMQSMREDERRSMEAQDLARHYRNALERAVGEQGVVADLTCGVSLCMGLVSAPSLADHDAWQERLYEDPAAVRHVTLHALEKNGDQLQNRFLFSTDSAIKGIALPPRRNR